MFWNFNFVDGVEFVYVVVIGQGVMGIVNIDESILIEFMNNKVVDECGVILVCKLVDYWFFVQWVKVDNSFVYKDVMKKNKEMYKRYVIWFECSFNI